MIWGVTGCVGAGKSTVCAILAGFGARVLDVDEVAAQALRESSLGLSAAQALQAIVTNSPDRARIEAALVPVVQARVEAWTHSDHPERSRGTSSGTSTSPGVNGTGVAVLDAAILFEYGLDRFCDFTLCVCCPIEQRRERVVARSTSSARLFDAIEASQWAEAQKLARSSHRVDGTLAQPELTESLSKLFQLQMKA